jgi:hypothetical protein
MNPDDAGDVLPVAESEEIDLPACGGSAYADGLVTTHLVGGETTLALVLSGEEVDLAVEHEADGLRVGTTATLSTAELRTLREQIDAVLESRAEGGEHQ